MKIIMMRYLIAICLLFVLQIGRQQACAQLSPMGALYFQNQYLGNPAMAGTKGLNVNLGIRQQWSSLPGAPATQILTADYAFAKKAGIGLNISNERSGLFKRMRTMASYAYHLPLNAGNKKLSFGLSLGFTKNRINNEDINGTVNDVIVAGYNQQDTYLDGDFGMAYTSDKLSVQATLPDMKDLFRKDLAQGSVNRSTFFSAISYKIRASGRYGIDMEPKVVYRGIKGLDNILDVGANLTYVDRVSFFGMYHTSQSASFGLGMNYQSFSIVGIYTTATSVLTNYTSGNFEIGLKANVF